MNRKNKSKAATQQQLRTVAKQNTITAIQTRVTSDPSPATPPDYIRKIIIPISGTTNASLTAAIICNYDCLSAFLGGGFTYRFNAVRVLKIKAWGPAAQTPNLGIAMELPPLIGGGAAQYFTDYGSANIRRAALAVIPTREIRETYLVHTSGSAVATLRKGDNSNLAAGDDDYFWEVTVALR